MAWMFFLILANCFYSHAYGCLSDNTYSLPEGKDMLMHPSCYGCLDYEWSSSDDSIITVNEYGIIHAGRVGSAEIKAVNKNDGSESGCRVEVTQPEPIRMVYASSTTACVDKEFEVVATTVKNAEKVKFVANYDEAQFAELTACENEELTYVIKINGVNYSMTGQHSALIAAGAVNAAVDMKIVVTPSSKIEKTA